MSRRQAAHWLPSPALAISAVLFSLVAIVAAIVMDERWLIWPFTLVLIASLGTMNASLAARRRGPLGNLRD